MVEERRPSMYAQPNTDLTIPRPRNHETSFSSAQLIPREQAQAEQEIAPRPHLPHWFTSRPDGHGSPAAEAAHMDMVRDLALSRVASPAYHPAAVYPTPAGARPCPNRERQQRSETSVRAGLCVTLQAEIRKDGYIRVRDERKEWVRWRR
ncbi:hypothetical protein N0V94_000154 [Neodidymelliopsis sp. IMI 364377]|nr:hypothetical protein N0V94_000154 [Neodidymelliopsis sp. IMI 364377]